ncbi:SDR family oxidoreductase [Leptospira yasudae]|uniref:Oxidoreductase n=1 Tax=Leptospira yasudae TaxID=2202201 RepID=A0ABX9M8M0_9LEPT|nr:SDR family NAD(P)-dependent oxidoreductase [Leptospira yasudae]RHX82433.1 oxidoreductase [Leptospira yasudae]TGK30176.1 SDR family NAD(P)-dependent oxidoreductase [Leptospira yasudae]TGM04444.1 SDR family NAD(P)-dependent oxidoreductase [Leptospira yasudae]TGN00969.1 SDR family NAD(P)-dependent oxidoreductase [Leptospira yasudae]
MKLSGNTILITGATSGIGLELAKRFAGLGNTVLALGRNKDSLSKLSSVPGIETIRCDLTKPADFEKLVSMIRKKYSSLNILINNAGIQYNPDFSKDPDQTEFIQKEIETNLTIPVRLISVLIPILKTHSESAIVNVTSGLALVPKRSAPLYCGTKAGLHRFTEALRYQLEGTHVKVIEMLPPQVDTPMTAGRGRNKLTTSALADEFIAALEKDRTYIGIGVVKYLGVALRLFPSLIYRMIKNA